MPIVNSKGKKVEGRKAIGKKKTSEARKRAGQRGSGTWSEKNSEEIDLTKHSKTCLVAAKGGGALSQNNAETKHWRK